MLMRKVFISWVLAFLLILPLSSCVTPPANDGTSGDAKQKTSAEPAAATTDGAPVSGAPTEAPQPTQAPRYSGPIEFVDTPAPAGLRFKHNSGAFGKKYMPETVGSGGA